MILTSSPGRVALLDFLGDDLTIVNAARVSYGKRITEMSERDDTLLANLIRDGHGTPLEHVVFQFRVTCPIFVARQWQRHRWGSYNEKSGRFKQAEPEFWITAHHAAKQLEGQLQRHYTDAWELYVAQIEAGVPREEARAILPQALITEFYWTVNARAAFNFIRLRNAEDAQSEIQLLAHKVLLHMNTVIPKTVEVFSKMSSHHAL